MGWKEIASLKLSEGIQGFANPDPPFTDCVICVEEREFTCHRIVLSSFSDYFYAMFTSGMQEDISCQVKLEDVPHQIFANILDALYKGLDTLDESNALEIWRVSNMLQISCLRQYSEDFLISHLSIENCIRVWRQAQHSANFNSRVLSFIAKEFRAIKSTDGFLTLTVEEITQLIALDDLNVANEDVVMDAVLLWLKGNEDSRAKNLLQLLSLVRLRCVSATFITDKLLSERMVRENGEAMDKLQQTLRYHLSLDRRHDECPQTAVFRGGCDLDNVLFVMEWDTAEVYAYQLKTGVWFHLPEFPGGQTGLFAACTYGEDIYVTGGDSRNSFHQFDVNKNKWLELAPMITNRIRHAQVAVGHCLYVLGGGNTWQEFLDSVECYNIKEDQWSTAGKLCFAVRSTGVAVSGNRIIVCGGIGRDGPVIKAQCFDTDSNTSYEIGTLPFEIARPKTLYKDGRLYFLSQEGQIVEISEEAPQTLKITPFTDHKLWSFKRSLFGAAIYNDSLICIGGGVPEVSELQTMLDVEVPGLCKRVQNLTLNGSDESPIFTCLYTVMANKYLNKAI